MMKDEHTRTNAGKILLMDDELIVRTVTGKTLNRLGYEVELAGNGDEAVELYRNAMKAGEPFDAVILDLTIPEGMGGKEAVKRLLEIDPGVRAIVSSGYSDDPVMTDFRRYGFHGVVPKPYDFDELREILRAAMTGGEKQ